MAPMDTTTLLFPAQHPAFDGHFPGAPLLPGVVLLDEMLRLIESGRGSLPEGWSISTAKFLHPVRPGETLTFACERPLTKGAVRFVIRGASDGHIVASGTLVARLAPTGADHGDQAR